MKWLDRLKKNVAVALLPEVCPYCERAIDKEECACRWCRKKFPKLAYTRYAYGGYLTAAPFPYSGKYADAVQRFKFHDRACYARALAVQIVEAVLEICEDKSFDMVCCVPMHPKDQEDRGYNQAELLARECAEIMGLPYVDALEKFKRNRPQHRTKGRGRKDNVHGVYRLIRKDVAGKHVLLIDDIITTGFTLGECARMLAKGGCRRVTCAVVCTVTTERQEEDDDDW